MGMTVCQRPLDSMQCETARYARISINVNVIIIVDEIVSKSLPKYKPGGHRQQNADANIRRTVSARPVIARDHVILPHQILIKILLIYDTLLR